MELPFEQLRDDILSTNNGHVYLTQQSTNVISIIPSRVPLPTVHPCSEHICSFCNDDVFKAAVARGDRTVALQTPRGNIVIVPTAKHASLWDFARCASKEDFKETMLHALRFRDVLFRARGIAYKLETHGHDVPHFHVRLMAPSNPAMHAKTDGNNNIQRWRVPDLY